MTTSTDTIAIRPVDELPIGPAATFRAKALADMGDEHSGRAWAFSPGTASIALPETSGRVTIFWMPIAGEWLVIATHREGCGSVSCDRVVSAADLSLAISDLIVWVEIRGGGRWTKA